MKNKIVGFYSYKYQGENLKLENLFIDPDHIGEGLGKLLLRNFLERSTSISKERIILESDPNAELFYSKHGFRTIALQKTSIRDRFMPIMMRSNSNSGKMKLFESKRLFVRHLEAEDIEAFYKMQSNPNVMKYIKPPMNYEESKNELNRFIGYYGQKKIMFSIWAIIEKQTESFAGVCGAYLNDKYETEIAFRFQQTNWGKGYGKEIAKKLIDFCFITLDYESLFAYVMDGNEGSRKILERYMNYEQEIYSEKNSSKEYIYSITKENWL